MTVPVQLRSPAVRGQACQHWQPVQQAWVQGPCFAAQRSTIFQSSSSAKCAQASRMRTLQSQKWRASGFFQGLFGGGGQPAGREADASHPVLPPEELPFPLGMLADTPLRSARHLASFSWPGA